LITDVFRSRPLLCTIHRLINFTLASVENVPVVPAVLDKGHQSKRTHAGRPDRGSLGPDFAMLAPDKHDRLTSDSCRILRRKMRPGWPEENKSADYMRSVTTAVDGSHRLAAFRRTKPAVIECDSTAKACTLLGV